MLCRTPEDMIFARNKSFLLAHLNERCPQRKTKWLFNKLICIWHNCKCSHRANRRADKWPIEATHQHRHLQNNKKWRFLLHMRINSCLAQISIVFIARTIQFTLPCPECIESEGASAVLRIATASHHHLHVQLKLCSGYLSQCVRPSSAIAAAILPDAHSRLCLAIFQIHYAPIWLKFWGPPIYCHSTTYAAISDRHTDFNEIIAFFSVNHLYSFRSFNDPKA